MLLAGPISHTSTQYIDFVDFLHFNGSVYQVVLLAGPISHTSTQYIDFVDFLHFSGSVYQLFCSF